LLRGALRATAREAHSPAVGVNATAKRLDAGWEFHRGALPVAQHAWGSESPGSWEATELPHCFNALNECDPDQSYYRGQGWYRARIDIENPFEGGRTLLNFQGAGQTTTVWVGSILIGTHTGGYDEFSFDISDALAHLPPGSIGAGVPVAVCCDNTPDPDRIPSELSDFCLYGGLYRHVSLCYLPPVAVDAVHIEPSVELGGPAKVSVLARLYNPLKHESSCRVAVEIGDNNGRAVHRSTVSTSPWEGYRKVAEVTIPEPALWAPDTPHLYRCRVVVTTPEGESEVTERFGIRTAEFLEHGPFKLNGERLLLKGTHRHAEHAGVAAAMSDDLVRQEMQMIRDMGANFIRLAHYQQDRLVLDLCDELGLLVWEELPWCRSGVVSDAMKQNARTMLTDMIDQHFNHPSIILWGLGNEDDWPTEQPAVNKPEIRQFMTDLRDLAHQLDHSRLTSVRRCEFARDIPDVYSPSIWAGWYRGQYREYEQSLKQQRDRVSRFIHMEWGADSHAGRHSENPEAEARKVPEGEGTDERGLAYLSTGGETRVSRDGDWSETYACNLFDWYLKTQEKQDWLTGTAQWVFKDFASPLRGDNAIPRVNQKGVVERDLRKKESYYLFQSYWAQKPMLHIYGHTWPVRWGDEGETRPVHVYSNCKQVELFLNGKSLGVKRRDSQDFPAAGLRWDAPFAKGENRLRAVAIVGGTTISDEVQLTYETEKWGSPASIRLQQKHRRDGLITVVATLVDAQGRLCLDAATWVRFWLDGAGKLIDNLGTTRGSRVLQLANGRAEISFICSGSGTVGVEPNGLPPATLRFEVQEHG
jgi:beta-galactosidase